MPATATPHFSDLCKPAQFWLPLRAECHMRFCLFREQENENDEGTIESHGAFWYVTLWGGELYWAGRHVVSNGIEYEDCWLLTPVYSVENPTELLYIDGAGAPGPTCPWTADDAVYTAQFYMET